MKARIVPKKMHEKIIKGSFSQVLLFSIWWLVSKEHENTSEVF
jgi:uncharacterized protein YktA (UPF0223 family)